MDLVLKEKVDHWRKRSKEGHSEESTPFHSRRIVFGSSIKTSELPRESANKVDNHGNVMGQVVVGASNVSPAATRNRSYQTNNKQKLAKSR